MTRRACVIGYPIKHSRSPLIHGHWLRDFGIDGAYDLAEVPPADFASFIGDLSAHGYVGANVTVPHKGEAFRLATVEDPVADALGAANLLWLDGPVLRAANTDVEGFLVNLDSAAPGWDEALGEAVVLGAGGASRAVAYGLLARGAEKILIANRTLARATELAAHFGPRVEALEEGGLPAAMRRASLLVNTTSLGMAGQPQLRIDLSPLPPSAIVTDLVYVPLETDLLRQARARGLVAVDGLGMLLHQAVPAFERWFGVRPAVTPALRDLVVADLAPGAAS
jgi:shikimate dehydrogenase